MDWLWFHRLLRAVEIWVILRNLLNAIAVRSQKSVKSAKSVVERIPVGRSQKFVRLTFPSAVELNLREIRVQKKKERISVWRTKSFGRRWFRSSWRCSPHWEPRWEYPAVWTMAHSKMEKWKNGENERLKMRERGWPSCVGPSFCCLSYDFSQ